MDYPYPPVNMSPHFIREGPPPPLTPLGEEIEAFIAGWPDHHPGPLLLDYASRCDPSRAGMFAFIEDVNREFHKTPKQVAGYAKAKRALYHTIYHLHPVFCRVVQEEHIPTLPPDLGVPLEAPKPKAWVFLDVPPYAMWRYPPTPPPPSPKRKFVKFKDANFDGGLEEAFRWLKTAPPGSTVNDYPGAQIDRHKPAQEEYPKEESEL